MKLDKINTVYFLGIGGIGMSAIARFFLLRKKQVFGYDLAPTEITTQLIAEGAHIHFEEDIDQIPTSVDIVVFTPAIPKEHAEYQHFIERQTPLLKRSEMLGIICKDYPTIAVAGTHGKTTTTAMVTQILSNVESRKQKGEGRKEKGNLTVLRSYGLTVLSFIGGIAKNFNSNFVCEPNYDTVIVEADEFDRSFLTLQPQVAIITSLDADHLDVYGDRSHLVESFQLFANQIQPGGTLVIYDEIADQIEHPNKVTYGFSEKANYCAYRLPLTLNVPGKHNTLNALAALAACMEFALWKDNNADISKLFTIFNKKLSGFTGVKRRFDIRVQRNDFMYIDDYAHHPEAINAFLDAVKSSYPTKKLTGVFQPHLYSRTRDFAKEFASSLEVLDEIILLDIYPAREEPIEGITSDYLLSFIKNENKKLLKKEELVAYVQSHKPEVLLTMGAGDIDKLVNDLELISIERNPGINRVMVRY